jgi:hypothetical protein
MAKLIAGGLTVLAMGVGGVALAAPPEAGSVGNANPHGTPKGQETDGSKDGNNGWRCDGNNGVGGGNPAHILDCDGAGEADTPTGTGTGTPTETGTGTGTGTPTGTGTGTGTPTGTGTGTPTGAGTETSANGGTGTKVKGGNAGGNGVGYVPPTT